MRKSPRPTGISIIAILDLIGGIMFFLLGVFFVAVSSAPFTASIPYHGYYTGYISYAVLAAALGAPLAISGLLAIFVGYGMWVGKGWAWTLAVVLYAVGLLLSLFTIAIGVYLSAVGLIADAFFLLYLWRPNVRAYFGRRQSAQILGRLVRGDF